MVRGSIVVIYLINFAGTVHSRSIKAYNVSMNGSKWGLFDVIVAGLLIAILIGALSYASRKTSTKRQRYVAFAVIILVFVFVWGELAVGLIGSPLAGD